MATITTGVCREARGTSDRARRRSSSDDAHGYGANPSSATPTPLTVSGVIWPGRPVHGTPARPSAANVWDWPEAPKSNAWLLATLTASMPAQRSAGALPGGAWNAKQFFALPPHFDAPPREYVPSRLAIVSSAAESSGRAAASWARPWSGGTPYFEPGVRSPTHWNVNTGGATASRARRWSAERRRKSAQPSHLTGLPGCGAGVGAGIGKATNAWSASPSSALTFTPALETVNSRSPTT